MAKVRKYLAASALIDEIRLVPEDAALKIELRGELAGILALASESTKARGLSTTGLAEQIKMVAGRGFEPSDLQVMSLTVII